MVEISRKKLEDLPDTEFVALMTAKYELEGCPRDRAAEQRVAAAITARDPAPTV
jgi:hypothetical protein